MSDVAESMAGLETHDKVLAQFRRYVPENARVIDLGAGQGAFSRRIADLGHTVVAVDSDPDNWKLTDVPVLDIDLDSEFAERVGKEKFGAVVAIEILEHVENPFGFVRQSARLLEDGGLLFLTTPNVESVNSRLIFLYTGRLRHFGKWETVRPAHITPIFRWKLEMMLEEAGFDIVEEGFNRFTYATGTNLKGRAAALVAWLLGLVVKGDKGGECRIIVARKRKRN